MFKECVKCNNEYEGRKQQIFCEECLVERKKKRAKIYRENNKEKRRAYNKLYYANNRNKILKKAKIQSKLYYNNNKALIKKRRQSFESQLKRKCNNCKIHDKHYKRYVAENFITTDWIKAQLNKQKNKCHYCKRVMKLEKFQNNDKEMYTIDRINNKYCHTQDNCLVACYKCNLSRGSKLYADYVCRSNQKCEVEE